MSGSLAASAATGGGGVGGGGGGGGTAAEYWLYTGDNFDGVNDPAQGWGQTSIDYFAGGMEQQARWSDGVGGNRTGINQACGAAIDQAVARSNGTSNRARVIQVGVAVDYIGSQAYMGWGGGQAQMQSWYQGLTAARSWQGQVPQYDNALQVDVFNSFMANIVPQPRIVCVALNDGEGGPANYDLSLDTDKASTFALAGSTATVSDNINTSTPSSIRENINAVVTLRWGGVEGNPKFSSKNVTISNSGTTSSPGFTPGDFGFSAWPAGAFWFDVSVAQQGKMNAAVNHDGGNDARESWSAGTTPPRKVLTSGVASDALGNDEVLASGMFYNAQITARTNGITSSMTISDTIGTDKVFIGAQASDVSSAAYVLDPNGNKTAANITINRSGGKVTVSGTVTSIPDGFQALEYTLIVPTYVMPTKADYTITDDSKVCYTASQTACIAGNSAQTRKITPVPDKVWVLDANGALATADPAQTNQAGVDNKVFSPGADIGAVVNGSVPAKLAENLSSYSLTDDWTDAAKFVDFSDTSKAKVFLNGIDVTSQFDITIVGTTTVATAKATFLNSTKGLTQARSVKLYVGGSFRLDYETDGQITKLTNSGSEKWNNEAVTTNTPAIYTVTPNPDKVWVLDEKGALTTSDPNGTNSAGVDNKTFAPGAGISAVVNGSVPANLGAKLNAYVITDDWTSSATYVDFSDVSKAKVFLDGANVTNQFDIAVIGTKTVATAKATFLNNTAFRAAAGVVKLFITGAFRNTYDTNGALDRLTNAASESWNGKSVETATPALFTVTPTPDKVWVLDEQGGLSTSDKDWSDTAGADGKVFLQNDAVAAVVNGSIPANLGSPLYNYSITDDWTDAAQYVDFTQVALAKVFYNGVDVTAGFDVNIVGTTTVATAKAPFLAATEGLAKDGAVKLIISGVFRADYDTNGQIVTLSNAGTETWNNRTDATNTPPVYTWTPNPNKEVLGSTEESGDKGHSDINGAAVWPGQKLEYSVGVDLRIPAGTARGVKTLAVEDAYDPYFVPDKTSVEFWDSRDNSNPKPVARAAYTLTFDEAAHTFTATFKQSWIDANVGTDGANDKWLTQGWLTMRFTGTVSKAVVAGSSVVNQAFQILNGARTGTEIPTVAIPAVTPVKDSLNTNLIDINGKTVVEGDVILYRLTMDGGPARDKLAYNVHKFGMVDDYDEVHLALSDADITVTEKATGLDVTGKFNVKVTDGVAYVFAKTVDTAGTYGGTIAGDPQASDLAAYDAATIKPLEDPIIDQTLLGKNYWITMKATVTKAEDGYVIQNQASQNIQNTHYATKIVSNPLKAIDPSKDVVVSEETQDASLGGTEVRMNTVFNYRLNSSEIPANRAYTATQWSLTDPFDKVHDQYTGIWAVYANTDIYQGSTLIFKKGDLLQDSAGRESESWTGFFDVTFDEASYTVKIEPTQKYLDLVGTRDDLASSFSAYTKMVRIAPSDKIENKVSESYNKFARDSNIVWTKTIEYPAIEVKKFTLSEGETDGSHSDAKNAYAESADQLKLADLPADAAVGTVALQNGVEVGVRFTNTGDVPLTNVTVADITQDGMRGDLEGLVCAVPAAVVVPPVLNIIQGATVLAADANGMDWVLPSTITTLAAGQTVDCKGTLRGMAPGMTHGDTVVVTGESVFTKALVKAEDAWFAKAPSTPSLEVVKYTLDEGRDAGDRNAAADALALTPEQGTNGVQVGFDVTNTGDEPLKKLAFVDQVDASTTGTVTDVKWLDPLVPAVSSDPAVPAAAAPVTIGGTQYTPRPLTDLTELAVGQKVLLVGLLTGVQAGTDHSDTASVTAEAAYSGTVVSDSDPWNAKLAALPPIIAIAGDPLSPADAKPWLLSGAALLLLAAGVAAYGVRRRQLVPVTNTTRKER
ncbi:LPXTG cell wall anchor domain-containing protein [Cryobacterium zhongshanensis]|uniref:LPXTG cell wall anchor domain-containing protein n=1 Tax=Cryobacterium zhongshanensis TaxID=2928153 RepID=A0AA41QXX2_9MICO|nr:LPXTG cell wall anchor domain-containing protein [Cryobacterium zhongshanensis]MCI4659726.1 LPXTG cell wall anchor domain-containing protein [Cryobacterium zhongshanensis]